MLNRSTSSLSTWTAKHQCKAAQASYGTNLMSLLIIMLSKA